ncbi:NitT/TauT family transport system ATP-binding protein [Kaistia soli DSM 19436]|uniref:NitT/TauT family transport system ATP-binding protein n=1 Tax=Kaistia soli DSM 19436 TaxID=1122133 RepID=A0A1M5NM97_9HYPH|nr:ABC transporter ATP-binding protein [Kaistia soli]SHG90555.1 NitT/TauT family transport system ATP-binding protein [Kaistia soli DSM 19436]
MNAISVKDVWKEYDGRVILENINLEIAPRAFVALVGPSGCGKTTFLRMLLSEERPDRGSITIARQPLPAEPGADRGVVFQRYSVFPHLTVLGNVVLGLELKAAPLLGRLFGSSRRAAEDEARGMLAAVGLAGSEEKYPAQLSGGMQQRLALAQALIAKPKVLLLDEPFGALDPGIRAEIHVLMQKLWHERPLTVVMVTHDLSEAFSLGTRVIAFERRRNEPSDGGRYGATITRDFAVWPKRIAGEPRPPKKKSMPGRDDPVPLTGPLRDDPALQGDAP